MRLTKRDLALLSWINEFGFVTAVLVSQQLGVSRSVAYRRLSHLVRHHYLSHQSIYFGMPGVYSVTRLGVAVSGSSLSALRSIPPGHYHHDLCVVALSRVLCERWNATFISERRLRQQAGSQGVGRSGHFCDGVLVCVEELIAIEVELSRKGQRRREKIMQHYLKSFDYPAVWYFYRDQAVKQQLTPFLKTLSFLKLHRLSDFIET